MRRITFILVLICALIAIDIYVFQGYKLLIKKWLPDMQQLMNVVYWGLPVLLILIMVFMAMAKYGASNSVVFRFVMASLVMVYLAKFCWLFFLIIDDVVRLARYLAVASDIPNEAMIEKINRSDFLVSLGAIVSGSLIGGMVYGIVKGAHNYQVNHRMLPLKGLPKVFEGLKIIQISDIHSGSFWSKSSVEKGIELIQEQGADMIFFTGDLVNNKSEEFEDYKEIFGKLSAPLGIYSVLGNHDYGDYYSWPDEKGMSKKENLEKLISYQKEIGWDLLINEHRIIEREGEKLAVIGVENWGAHSGFPQYGRLDEAYAGSEEAKVKLLLSHDPSHWKAEILEKFNDIQATFSGHTHGMQFGIDSKYYRWSPVKYRYPEWADLYTEGEQHLYVNRGFGYLGYPGRLGFNPEITVFELRSA